MLGSPARGMTQGGLLREGGVRLKLRDSRSEQRRRMEDRGKGTPLQDWSWEARVHVPNSSLSLGLGLAGDLIWRLDH